MPLGREPKNIQRMVARNEELAAHKAHASMLKKESVKTQWFDKAMAQAGSQPFDFMHPAPMGDQDALTERSAVKDGPIVAQQLAAANFLLKQERAHKLKQLFDRETLQWEAELHSMGLALNKTRL